MKTRGGRILFALLSGVLAAYTRTGDILPLVSLTLTAALSMLAVFKKAT
jgi:hypothetical protein